MAEDVVLYQFPAIFERNVSPFTLKLEAWLKLAGIPYRIETGMPPFRAPTGTLPALRDGGQLLGDSEHIIAHLSATRGIDLDAGLDVRQRSDATALRCLLECHLYALMTYARWIEPAGWAVTRRHFFAFLPAPARAPAAFALRRTIAARLRGQGLARLPKAQIYAAAAADLDALAERLAANPWLLDGQPRTIDVSAFGFLANIVDRPIPGPLKDLAMARPALADFTQRAAVKFGFAAP